MYESPIKSDEKFVSRNVEILTNSLWEQYSQLETILIDKYISEKYNKHVDGIREESLEKELEIIYYLENTFSDFKEKTKMKYVDFIKSLEYKVEKLLYEMKDSINIFFELLYQKGKNYLEELNIEVRGIKNMEGIDFEIENKNDNGKNIIEKFDFNNIFDLDKFDKYKYNLKIIEKPNIIIREEEEKKNRKRNNYENKKYHKELILTKEDIYNIVSKFYEYNFTMINKSLYNLEIKKEELETEKLSQKLLPNIKQNIIEVKDEEDIYSKNSLIKLNKLNKFKIY